MEGVLTLFSQPKRKTDFSVEEKESCRFHVLIPIAQMFLSHTMYLIFPVDELTLTCPPLNSSFQYLWPPSALIDF